MEWVSVQRDFEVQEALARSVSCDGNVSVLGNLTVIKSNRCEGTLDCGGDIISGVTPFYPDQPAIVCVELINGNVKYGEVWETGSDTEDTEE